MSTGPNNLFAPQDAPTLLGKTQANPQLQKMQQATEDAVAFQMWVSQQSHALSRLKVFHSMAKSINDQQ